MSGWVKNAGQALNQDWIYLCNFIYLYSYFVFIIIYNTLLLLYCLFSASVTLEFKYLGKYSILFNNNIISFSSPSYKSLQITIHRIFDHSDLKFKNKKLTIHMILIMHYIINVSHLDMHDDYFSCCNKWNGLEWYTVTFKTVLRFIVMKGLQSKDLCWKYVSRIYTKSPHQLENKKIFCWKISCGPK